MDMLIVFGAKYLIYIVAFLFIAFVALHWSRHIVLLSLISLPVAYLVARLAGLMYNHVQPFAAQNFTPLIQHAVDNSFPSDHTLLAGVMASIVFLYNRKLGGALWILALCIGIARVYAGVHYPVDIAASVVIAIVAVAVVAVFLRRKRS